MATTSSYQRQQAPPYNDDEGLNTDEEEEERRLSELHGEASDDNDNTNTKKRKRPAPTNDTKLTEEDATAAKEFEEKIRKKVMKPRPQFTPQLLTSGSNGLVYLRRSFPNRVAKFRPVGDNIQQQQKKGKKMDKKQQDLYKKRHQTTQINAAARYSSSLLSAYTEFARSLFPSLAPADVFLKIEALGSKKEVKDFLQVMREDVRKEYLIRVYEGDVEKVERLLGELEYGVSVGGAGVNALMGGGDENANNDGNEEEEVQYDDGAAAVPRVGVRADAQEMEEEEEAASSPPVPAAAPVPVSNPYKKSEDAEPTEVSAPVAETELGDEERPLENEEGQEQIVSAASERGEKETASATNEEEEAEAEFEEELELTEKSEEEEDAANDETIMPDVKQAETQSVNESAANNNTQETLTLVESQDDERFSQAMNDDDLGAEASQDEPEQNDKEEIIEERFSQVNTSKDEEVGATQEDSFSQEENTFEERFSQVTDRVTFEEGTYTQPNDDDRDDAQENSPTLGQMTSTQLSMEY
mmetsp:Transcript_18091/g.28378  ORF Transcript_18091/g.28378 Transcript_18091/m.28378 type:complete len:528 (+) Transcript_18091:19-1602(+)|eukprot:CAMPEP_0201720576 /NCGR_PEP_ID=MMETSP0593-20130828/5472_1 /ASSEMBLY_ACC=CAM_ASM_000672 /TAXON_ID=267983 /ORGANISM="Skeletonema japonicum, Strain CCMP2506" /LENGTH=527 /DNA_ID=CAMNT_0048211237 /DNA_START=8 /DNA_END=1591 /DNA_ORIENTATION=-